MAQQQNEQQIHTDQTTKAGISRFRTGNAKSGFQYSYLYKGVGLSGMIEACREWRIVAFEAWLIIVSEFEGRIPKPGKVRSQQNGVRYTTQLEPRVSDPACRIRALKANIKKFLNRAKGLPRHKEVEMLVDCLRLETVQAVLESKEDGRRALISALVQELRNMVSRRVQELTIRCTAISQSGNA